MEFTQVLVDAMASVWTPIAAFIPRLFGAMVVVLLGFVVAKFLDTLLSKLLGKIGLDRLMAGTGLTKLLSRAGIQVPVSTLIGKIVYWFVLLIFLVTAAESWVLSGFPQPSMCWPCTCRKCSVLLWCCWRVYYWRNWSVAWYAVRRKVSAWITPTVWGVLPKAW